MVYYSMNKEDAIIATFTACLILIFTAVITSYFTRGNMEKEAVANGAGHWAIVAGEAEFAWGLPQE